MLAYGYVVARPVRLAAAADCVMADHVHQLPVVRNGAPGVNLAAGMRWLLGSRRADVQRAADGRSGHRPGALGIASTGHEPTLQLWMLVRYLAVNPVKAELCKRAADWRWSSHGVVAASRLPRWLDHSRLLHYFAAAGGDPAERYAAMIASD